MAAGTASPTLAQDPSPAGVASQTSVDLPPALDRVLRDYERHWRDGNAEALSELFVDAGLIVRQGTWIRGRPAIKDAYQNASGPLQLRAIAWAAEGRLGYIIGAYGYGEAPPVDDSGMFVLTLERTGEGPWLIVSDLDRGVS